MNVPLLTLVAVTVVVAVLAVAVALFGVHWIVERRLRPRLERRIDEASRRLEVSLDRRVQAALDERFPPVEPATESEPPPPGGVRRVGDLLGTWLRRRPAAAPGAEPPADRDERPANDGGGTDRSRSKP